MIVYELHQWERWESDAVESVYERLDDALDAMAERMPGTVLVVRGYRDGDRIHARDDLPRDIGDGEQAVYGGMYVYEREVIPAQR